MRLVVISCLWLFVGTLSAQTYEMKVPPSAQKKEDLLKELKDYVVSSPQLTFFIRTQDLYEVFDSIPEAVTFDDDYLKTAEDSLAKDPMNPIYLNKVAQYCDFHGLSDMAKTYHKKTYDHLKVSYFDDSAAFYSFRGLLKLNFLDSTGMYDLKRSIDLDKNNHYLDIYMVALFNQGRNEEAKEYCVKIMESGNDSTALGYLYLLYTEIFFPAGKLQAEVGSDEAKKKDIYQKYYKDIIDYTLLEKYGEMYAHLPKIQHLKRMMDISGLLMKLMFAESDDRDLPIIQFTKKEEKEIVEMIAYFETTLKDKTMNAYSANFVIGFLQLLNKDYAMAEKHFELAINNFQDNRVSQFFSPLEAYTSLVSTHALSRNEDQLIKTLERAIDNEPAGHPTHDFDNLLASIYLKKNQLEDAYRVMEHAITYKVPNFHTLSLFAHLNYVAGYPNLAQKHLENASILQASQQQQFTLLMQAALYQLDVGNATAAYDNLKNAKLVMGGDCEDCDALIEKYILIKE